jgi:hypothetical protein
MTSPIFPGIESLLDYRDWPRSISSDQLHLCNGLDSNAIRSCTQKIQKEISSLYIIVLKFYLYLNSLLMSDYNLSNSICSCQAFKDTKPLPRIPRPLSIPSLPRIPRFPRLPSLQSISSLPSTPSIRSLPRIPSLSSVLGIPSLSRILILRSI